MAAPTAQDIARLQADLEAAIRVHQEGKRDEAEERYKRILDRAPSQPDALNLLGVVQSEKNRNEYAIELIARASRLRPKDGSILNNLGRACVRARRFEQAIDALERAIALAPGLVESYGNLIQAHRSVGNVAEANYYIDALRALKDGSITADYEQARLSSDLGDKEKARQLLLRLTREHPQFAPGWHALARLERVKEGDPILDGIVREIERAAEPSASLKFLCYAAGKAFDDLGDYDRAFAYFSRAKQQDPPTYDPGQTQAQFKAISDTFSRAFFAARQDYGVAADRPIFIVGMPRSGTSLAEQILASHPDVFGAGELEYVAQITSQVADHVQTGKFPQAASQLSRDALAAFAHRYLRKLSTHDQTAVRTIDKMPHNFLSLGMLRVMFRNLRVIHCVRHPFDTCLSCFMHDFAHSHSYNRSLEGLASYYQMYRELMEHWEDSFGDRIHLLQYENLLSDQRVQSEALLDFAGLEWRDGVMDFSRTERRVATPSNWQVRQPLFHSSSGRWKNYERHILPALSAIDARFLPS